MNRKQLGFGLFAIFIMSLFFGNNTCFFPWSESQITQVGETQVTPASDWVQGVGAMDPAADLQATYLKNISDWLVSQAEPASGGVTWSSGIANKTGYYDGIAGIVSFLAKMYQETKNETYLETARKAAYWLSESGAVSTVPGKYTESDTSPRNYTGLEKGAAGIGEMYLDLFQVTGNQTYLTRAQKVAEWLLGMADVEGNGMRWSYKEPIVFTDLTNNPSNNRTINGTTTDPLTNLNTHDGNMYEIESVTNGSAQVVDCEFTFKLNLWGLYDTLIALEEIDKILNFTMQMTVISTASLAFSNVSIESTTVPSSNITTTEQNINITTTGSISSYLYALSQFRVRVKASNPTSFIIQIDQLNITLSYNDTAYYQDWSLGAAGIGQYFIDLYKVTSNLTYYYAAANASRYLQETAVISGDGVYWDKKGTGYTSLADGAAGIGKFLVNLYKVNASDLIPRDLAMKAANWTLSKSTTQSGITENGGSLGMTRRIQKSTASAGDYLGGYYDGMAGIGDFLLDVASISAGTQGNRLFTAATEVAAFLAAYNITTTGGVNETLLKVVSPYTYRWNATAGLSSFNNGTASGAAGNLVFLSRVAQLTGSQQIGTVVDGGLRYLVPSPLYTTFSSNEIFLSNGLAGIGTALIQIGMPAGTAMDTALGGLDYLLTQQHNGRWNTSNDDGTSYSGQYQGAAGIGLAFLEAYQSTGDSDYLNAAMRAAENLSVATAQNLYIGSAVIYWGKGDGIAGIVDFLLAMFSATGNDTYLNSAENALYRILGANQGSLDYAHWPLTNVFGAATYNGYRDGAAGIATTFLHAFRVTANVTYLQVAMGALNYLDNQDQEAGFECSWYETDSSTTTSTGWDTGAAGIGYAYLQAYLMTGNQSYLNTAAGVSTWLSTCHDGSNGGWYAAGSSGFDSETISTGSAGIVNFLLQLYTSNASSEIRGEIDYGLGNLIDHTGSITQLGWSEGLAGIVSVLAQAITYNRMVNATLQARVQELLLASNRETSGAWHIRTGTYTTAFAGLANGSAGIFRVLSQLPDLTRPALTITEMDVADVSYTEDVSLTLTASDAYSNLSRVYLQGTYTSGIIQSTLNISGSKISLNTYQALIPARAWNTTVSFMLVVIDESGQVTFDNNGTNYYRYQVQDHTAPEYTLVHILVNSVVKSAPAYGQSASFRADVSDSTNGSGIASVNLNYTYNGIETSAVMTESFAGTYYATISGASWTYGQQFSFYVVIRDNAGNVRTTPVNSTVIGDYTSPTIYGVSNDLTHPDWSALTPLGVHMSIAQPPSGASSIPSNGGGFVLYTKDGVAWTRVNLTCSDPLATTLVFDGAIPATNVGDIVWFVFGAQDAAGNIIYIGQDGVTSDTLGGSFAEKYFTYTTSMNWLIFFVVVAVIAGIVVFGYVVYMRRGGYWQRMRRTASAKATAITIQEKFTTAYYWMLEKLQTLGMKLRKVGGKAGEKLQTFGTWAGEKLGERGRSIGRGIGRVIADFFRNIGNAIVGFFTSIKDLIIKVRWYQVLVFIIFGLVLMIFPIIRYLVMPLAGFNLSPEYPLRAVFFMGMGIVIFISGFVVAIMNLIYKITYK